MKLLFAFIMIISAICTRAQSNLEMPSPIKTFSVKVAAGTAYISWTAETPDPGSFFFIEYAESKGDFNVLDLKPAEVSPENTRLLYCGSKPEIFKGEHAFRVRMVLSDGSEFYSDVIQVEIEGKDIAYTQLQASERN